MRGNTSIDTRQEEGVVIRVGTDRHACISAPKQREGTHSKPSWTLSRARVPASSRSSSLFDRREEAGSFVSGRCCEKAPHGRRALRRSQTEKQSRGPKDLPRGFGGQSRSFIETCSHIMMSP